MFDTIEQCFDSIELYAAMWIVNKGVVESGKIIRRYPPLYGGIFDRVSASAVLG